MPLLCAHTVQRVDSRARGSTPQMMIQSVVHDSPSPYAAATDAAIAHYPVKDQVAGKINHYIRKTVSRSVYSVFIYTALQDFCKTFEVGHAQAAPASASLPLTFSPSEQRVDSYAFPVNVSRWIWPMNSA